MFGCDQASVEIRGSNNNVDNFTLKVAYVLMICRDGTRAFCSCQYSDTSF